MLHKILLIARRDFLATIQAKAFLFSLILAPLLFCGSFIALAVMKNKPDLADRHIAIVDHTGIAAAVVIQAIEEKNEQDMFDKDLPGKDTRQQTMPRYRFETVKADEAHADEAYLDEQRLALSARIRPSDLYAFLEIGAKAVHPDRTGGKSIENGIAWYSNESGFADARRWLSGPLNDGIRRVRLAEAGVEPSRLGPLLEAVEVRSMNLASKDEKTGAIRPAEKRSDLGGFVVPFAMALMIAMIVMLTAGPMLPAIAEDKMQRVHEMLLASATPVELIWGKVLAGLARSLTSALLYVGGAVLMLYAMAMTGLAPLELIPWFLVYMIAEVIMLCAIAAALGAACGSPQDAQSLAIVLVMPVMISMFLITPVLQNPNGGFATVVSFVPPFTPMIMLLRQAMPGGVPAWQPWVGLAGVALWTILTAWVAARIFRVAILMQGKPPSVAEFARWAIRG